MKKPSHYRDGAGVPSRSESRIAAACVGTVALLLLLAACAGVPSQEMSDARRAMDAAVAADAALHAPHTLQRGRAALAEAEQALAGADYAAARAAALDARTAAIEARFLARELAGVLARIETARLEGEAVGGAEALLQQAREAAAQGRVERALDLLTRARALSD